MIINGGNPVTFEIEPVGDGLYTVWRFPVALRSILSSFIQVKAPGDNGEYWNIAQPPTRQVPEVHVKLLHGPSSEGEFESTQLWRFERLDDEDDSSAAF